MLLSSADFTVLVFWYVTCPDSEGNKNDPCLNSYMEQCSH